MQTQHDFATDARSVLVRLREALLTLFTRMGVHADEPQEISRRFKLDKTLTWRLSRVMCDPDVWEASVYVPRRPSMQILTDRLAGHGAEASMLAEVWEAFEQYEAFVNRHAGDRDILEIMLNGLARDSSTKRLELFRKDGVQSNAALFGVCASIHCGIRVIVPSKTPGMLDLAVVVGFVGLRRLRADVPWVVSTSHAWSMGQGGHLTPEPLLPGEDHPLLKQFCSPNLPEVRAVREDDHTIRYVLQPGPVGITGAGTLMTGLVYRGRIPMLASTPGEHGEHGLTATTPAELLVHDVYVHRSLGFTFDPTVHVRGMLPGQAPFHNPGCDLPVPSALVRLGSPPDPSLPRHAAHRAIVLQMMQALGGVPSDFEGVRFQLTYPPMPTIAMIRHTLVGT